MGQHFNWVGYFTGVDHHYVHIATAVATSAVLIALAFVARLSLGRGEAAIVPSGRFSVKGAFEIITEAVYNLADMIIGKEGYKYVPLAAAIFFFVLINNFVGLIPGMTPATDNFNTTFAVGIFSFLYYNYVGLKSDPVGYVKHFFGPVWWLAPLILPIELISHAFRPLTLGIRLKGNIMADHILLGVFHDLVPVIVPIPFYLLGIIVCFMQAFVFSLLTMIYIMLAQPHDDH